MKNLFDINTSNEIVSRINRLEAATKPLWGKMTVAQMIKHSQAPLLVAFGDMKLKQSLIGVLFGKMAKKKLIAGDGFTKGLPTAKEFIVKDQPDFEMEKQKLISLVQRFQSNGPSGLTQLPHPFFGKLTDDEWDQLEVKHLDHHLNQFGV
ncbi:MAG: DUF1569 domain-containing protein [Chitinophagaceae bacterium]|nr:DUF1569 domain-containing protein [Chitinophagaceae bacterium]